MLLSDDIICVAMYTFIILKKEGPKIDPGVPHILFQ